MALFERGPQGPAGPPGRIELPGTSGDALYNSAGNIGATSLLRLEDGAIVHSGTPLHEEDASIFRKVGGSGSEARSQWEDVITTNATQATLGTLSIPAADFGDCIITLIFEVGIAYASSGTKGGVRTLRSTYKRSSGTLSLIRETDNTDTEHWVGTVVGGLVTDKPDNDTIRLRGTGIAVTDIQWSPSIHVIIAKVPA